MTGSYRPPPNSPPGGPNNGGSGNDNLKNYLIAAAFFIGMGTGVWFDTNASFTPSNVASTEIIDRKTPNSELCMANGFSSMVFDQRIFVSFNPYALAELPQTPAVLAASRCLGLACQAS